MSEHIQERIARILREQIGGLVIELATAKAVIEQHENALAEAKAGDSGRSDGARGADGPTTKDT